MRIQTIRRLLTAVTALCLLFTLLPSVSAATYPAEKATLTFSNTGITETVEGGGYSINGTALTITAAGTYRITGSCSEGSVTVSKGLTGVTLILDNLTLSSSTTAPIVVKKTCDVLLKLEGVSTLTDNEDASTEETNADFEGAALKVKSGSKLTVFGDGTLYAVGNAKNGIKGAAESALTVDGGSFVVTAANNGVAFDGSMEINAGTFEISAVNDGIKAVPDEGDTASAGTVDIHGGSFILRTQGDAIQAGSDLTITDGSFDIKTLNGYQSGSSFNADTMSCKGLKASGNDTETENATNLLKITGGSFLLDTADDALHSDCDVVITGGSFEIYAGDDGVHADTTLTLGSENGFERDPEITILASYEGLEAGILNAYSGKYYVVASDDGVNAAGGSSNGSDPGGGGDHFNPGRPGGPGGGGGGGGGSTGNYSINIYGGSLYVNCNGDGLDSNGTLNLWGGVVTVFSMRANGDNSPLDADGTITIQGATVLAAGGRGMGVSISSGSQKYFTSSSSYSANTILNVSVNGTLAASEKLPRNISYFLYSAPSMSSSGSCTVRTASSVTPCVGNAWRHAWDDGVVETAATAEAPGVMKYTCSDCGEVERKTIPQLVTLTAYTAEGGSLEDGIAVTFECDAGAGVTVYNKKDRSDAGTVDPTVVFARDGMTGEIDKSGDGQVNFVINVKDGFAVSDVTVEPEDNYTAIEGPARTGAENAYRITEITGPVTVTIETESSACEHAFNENGVCTKCGVAAPKITFACDEGVSITVSLTQDADSEVIENATQAFPRNSVTGEIDVSGAGQVNFVVNVENGYKLESITAEPASSYKNLKGPDETLVNNGYRLTRITGDVTVTVKTSKLEGGPCEHDYHAEVTPPTCTVQGFTTYTCNNCGDSYVGDYTAKITHSYVNGACTVCGEKLLTVSIDCGEGATVTVYETQKTDSAHEDDAKAVHPRDGDTGLIDCSGEGQINLVVKLEEGYTLESITAEPASSYKNLKGPADTMIENGYRITKIMGDLTVSVSTKPAGKVPTQPDKTALEESIEAAKAIDPGTYTEETVAALNAALTQAEAIAAKEDTTQAEVDAAADALNAALDALAPIEPPFRFDDVQDESKFYFDPVYWAVENGITDGMTETTFVPDGSCTRAQVVTFLWRADGKPEPTSNNNPFDDVKEGAFYYKAVLWAVEKGITNGTSDTTFSPDDTCTRGQIVTFLWRCEGKEEVKFENPFKDVADAAFYYKAVLWAVQNGITKGMTATTFVPDGVCNRGQVVTFLHRDKKE